MGKKGGIHAYLPHILKANKSIFIIHNQLDDGGHRTTAAIATDLFMSF